MKFAHMADCHIGSWRDPKLKDLSTEAFIKAVTIAIDHKVDFILIAGDLFNTALPGIDSLKSAVRQFEILRQKHIPVYIIPGSHDFSPSGKTMIDVLEEAGLAVNVVKGTVHEGKLRLKFTIDKKTGAKITGLLGKRGTLEKSYYEALDLQTLENEPGMKIFMFHSAIKELMPGSFSAMDAMELSYLPRGFDYYAGGHVHIVKEYSDENYRNVIYPGPLFPANFGELEALENGGLYIYDDGKIIREELNIKNTFFIDVDCTHKTPEEVVQLLMEKITGKEFLNTIVLARMHGTLKSGKVSSINTKQFFDTCYTHGAFYVMKSTSKVLSEEFEEIKIEHDDDIEDALIKEHLGQIKIKGMDADTEYRNTCELLKIFSQEKHEGEKVHEYEERVRKDADKLLEM